MRKSKQIKLDALRAYARRFIKRHLPGWHLFNLPWPLYANILGHCWFDTKDIGLALEQMLYWSKAKQRDLILHEIAHAMLGRGGHDAEWMDTAQAIGMRPREIVTDRHAWELLECDEQDRARLAPAQHPSRQTPA